MTYASCRGCSEASRRVEVRRVLFRDRRALLVYAEPSRSEVLGHNRYAGRICQHDDRLRVTEHEGDALARVRGIERKIGGAGFQSRDDGDRKLRDRSMSMATSRSGPAPRARKRRASWFARRFSSAQVMSSWPQRTAIAPGVLAACASKRSCRQTVESTSATGGRSPSSHWRSEAESMGTRERRRPGSVRHASSNCS